MDIKLIPEAEKEYRNLDGSLKKLVDDKFEDLEKNIEIIEVWGIGKKDKTEVYNNVGKRISERFTSPNEAV